MIMITIIIIINIDENDNENDNDNEHDNNNNNNSNNNMIILWFNSLDFLVLVFFYIWAVRLSKYTALVGYFNINCYSSTHAKHSMMFCAVISTFTFFQKITSTTRFDTHSCSCIGQMLRKLWRGREINDRIPKIYALIGPTLITTEHVSEFHIKRV